MIVKPANRDGTAGASFINAGDTTGVTTYPSGGPVTLQITMVAGWYSGLHGEHGSRVLGLRSAFPVGRLTQISAPGTPTRVTQAAERISLGRHS
jgi:hypothetical protein